MRKLVSFMISWARSLCSSVSHPPLFNGLTGSVGAMASLSFSQVPKSEGQLPDCQSNRLQRLVKLTFDLHWSALRVKGVQYFSRGAERETVYPMDLRYGGINYPRTGVPKRGDVGITVTLGQEVCARKILQPHPLLSPTPINFRLHTPVFHVDALMPHPRSKVKVL